MATPDSNRAQPAKKNPPVVRRKKALPAARSRPTSSPTSRESIRMKLASESSQSSKDGGDANLLVCFMNEALADTSDEEEEEVNTAPAAAEPKGGQGGEGGGGGEPAGGGGGPALEKLSAKYIARNNISTKKNHVIIPLKDSDSDSEDQSPDPSLRGDLDLPFTPPPKRSTGVVCGSEQHRVSDSEALSLWLVQIQLEAREKLRRAKADSKVLAEGDREKRLLSQDLEHLFGLKMNRRLNRQFLTERNIAQLQVILNYLLSRIEELNEKLVEYLMAKDELVMEQDSLLTDIEDIRKGIDNVH